MNNQQKLLRAAVALLKQSGLRRLTRNEIAAKAKVSQGLIHYYFGSTDELRNQAWSIYHDRITR